MEVLIIKLGAIGDVIRTTSVILGIKDKYGDCALNWVTKKDSLDILKNNTLINKIVTIENIKDLKSKDFDLVINLDDDFEACRVVSQLEPKKIIGAYLKNDKRVYTKNSSLWFDMGLISKFGKQNADKLKAENKKTYQELIYKILDLDYKKQDPILVLSNKELEFGKKFASKRDIHENNLIIGLNTGAGGRWQDKKLSIEETSLLIDKLNNKIIHDKKIKLLLFGGPEEKERNEKIKSLIKTSIIDTGCNNSLMEFASLVNLCDILITSDSLAMHIGTAFKKKIVAFFYPTSATEIELYGRGIKIIGKGKSYCSYQTKCDNPPKWDINEIVDAVKKLI